MRTVEAPNIVLIGMPGSGKTTLGRRLAIEHGLPFVDTDALIERREGRDLQTIVDTYGPAALGRAEEAALLGLDRRGAVIATGGSVIYSDAGMAALGRGGLRVFLDTPVETLRDRVGSGSGRGLLIEPGQTLDKLFEQRLPLYRKYADIHVHCGSGNEDESYTMLLEALRGRGVSWALD